MRRDKIAALAKTLQLSPSVITGWSNDEIDLDRSSNNSHDCVKNNSVGESAATLSEKLKELRLSKGLTQIEFARIFNIANGTVGNWETGKRAPDYDTLIKIADFYGVTIDHLLGRAQIENLIQPDKVLPDVLYRYDELSGDKQQEVIAFMEFKLAQQEKQKEQEEIKAIAEKAAEESKQHELKEAIVRINEKIAKGEFDPLNGQIAAYDGGSTSLEKKQAERVAEIKHLAQLIEEEQSMRGDK